MPTKKKKRSWYRLGDHIYRLSPTVRAAVFVALFGVVGGSGYLVYSASAAVNNRAFGGTCYSEKLLTVEVSGNFDYVDSKGGVPDYLVIAVNNNKGIRLDSPYAITYTDGSSQQQNNTNFHLTGKSSASGRKQYRSDQMLPGKAKYVDVYVQPDGGTSQTNLNKGCKVRITPRA